ncbi:putative GPI-anchored protein pfl2 [Diaphorina citri]|uniref:GPI-anchored protein pfl2 n=1 Tax=Diaphorina citri TaxID=121845 RepID=A0A3Q0JA75_DIACI|nr:putative GPI-anchored protein pfl2 [Diaphorina citri]
MGSSFRDDCCRNVYKILLIICKNRVFLRSLLSDNFILVVHKKLCRMKHGPHCMICSNAMIYGQGIINEISNETNSHYGFEEIMYLYRLQDQRIDTMSTSDTKSDIVPRSADNTNTANSSNTSDDTTKVPTSTDSISCKSSLDKTSNCGINPCVETPSIGHCNTSSLASNNPTTSSSSLQPLNSSEINPSTPFICVPSTSSGTTSENLSNNTTLNPSKTSENLSKPSSLVNPLTSSNTASFSLNPPTSSSNSNSNTFSTNNTSTVNPLISSSNTTTSINPLTSSCNSPSKSLPTNNTSSINPLMSFSKTAASSSSSINPSTPSSNNNTSSSSINTSSVNPLTSSSNTTSSPDTSGSLSLGADIEERLDVHIIRIMLHISYIKYPFEQLAYKHTWSTLVDYLVKVQQVH